MNLKLIKRTVISLMFFIIGIICYYLIFKMMTGYLEFNRILIFLASMIGVVCLYISLHVLKQG